MHACRRRLRRLEELRRLLGMGSAQQAQAMNRCAHLPLAGPHRWDAALVAAEAATAGGAPKRPRLGQQGHGPLKQEGPHSLGDVRAKVEQQEGGSSTAAGGPHRVTVKHELGQGHGWGGDVGGTGAPGAKRSLAERAATDGPAMHVPGEEGQALSLSLVRGFMPSADGRLARGSLMLELRKLRLLDMQARLRQEVRGAEWVWRRVCGVIKDYGGIGEFCLWGREGSMRGLVMRPA